VGDEKPAKLCELHATLVKDLIEANFLPEDCEQKVADLLGDKYPILYLPKLWESQDTAGDENPVLLAEGVPSLSQAAAWVNCLRLWLNYFKGNVATITTDDPDMLVACVDVLTAVDEFLRRKDFSESLLRRVIRTVAELDQTTWLNVEETSLAEDKVDDAKLVQSCVEAAAERLQGLATDLVEEEEPGF
jgi:hypothetical protein